MAMVLTTAQAPHLRIAFSMGLTRHFAREEIDDMIDRAERALYAAKAGGCKRTVTL